MNAADKLPPDIRGEAYAGAATCVKCHKDLTQSFAHNAHGLTSKPVVDAALLKIFSPDSNRFLFDEHQKVVIEKRDSGIFQVAYQNNKAVRAQKFDIHSDLAKKRLPMVIGMGISYIELPLSHFSAIQTGPLVRVFLNNTFYYDRAITSRCLECHASYVKYKNQARVCFCKEEEMEKGSVIYGIDCERCHGPGKQHVVFPYGKPGRKNGKIHHIL